MADVVVEDEVDRVVAKGGADAKDVVDDDEADICDRFIDAEKEKLVVTMDSYRLDGWIIEFDVVMVNLLLTITGGWRRRQRRRG